MTALPPSEGLEEQQRGAELCHVQCSGSSYHSSLCLLLLSPGTSSALLPCSPSLHTSSCEESSAINIHKYSRSSSCFHPSPALGNSEQKLPLKQSEFAPGKSREFPTVCRAWLAQCLVCPNFVLNEAAEALKSLAHGKRQSEEGSGELGHI